MRVCPILYDYLYSGNAYRVRLLLQQLGVEYECREVDILSGETHKPWFLVKNPMGQIPVLELPDGTCIRESSAILIHLARGTEFLPQDQLQQTRVLEWLCFEQSNIDQVIGRARFRKRFPEVIPTRPEEFVTWHKQGNRALAIMDAHLETKPFFVNESYSIADIALYSYTHKADEGGFELGRYPAVQAWFKRVESTSRYLPIDQVPK
jgi:glutathione S-transferase